MRHCVPVRIELDDGTEYDGSDLALILTEAEARDLAEALVVYFSEEPRDAGWHDHLDDRVTLAIEPSPEPLGIRMGLDGQPL
jgi:hypothetical protein